MSATTLTPPPAADPAADYGGAASFRRFTVGEYQSMIRQGIIAADEPIELLEGFMVQKMPRGPEHDNAIRRLAPRLYRMVPPGWVISPQLGTVLTDSQPEPDFAIARGDDDTFAHRQPGPADVVLLVEVADSSLSRDTRPKLRIYARDGIPEYWVVNIPDRRIEVYADPTGPADAPTYCTRAEFPVGTTVPVVFDGTEVGRIAVADVIA